MVRRVFLFLSVNILVMLMVTFVLSIFNVQPFFRHYGIDYTSLMIFCFLWGMCGAFISLALSRKMAKWMVGVKIVDPLTKDPEVQQLLTTVKKLSQDAGLSTMPEVGIFASNELNAFATGPTKKRSLVAISTGLLRHMKQEDISAILGHEISHIANGDMVTMTLIQGIVNAFVMFLARIIAYSVSGLGRNRNNQGGGYFSYFILLYLFEIIFMVLGSIVVASFSRFREYRADEGGARLAGKDNMISALKTLHYMREIRDPKMQKTSLKAFMISSPTKKTLISLFASHPSLEKRINRLNQVI